MANDYGLFFFFRFLSFPLCFRHRGGIVRCGRRKSLDFRASPKNTRTLIKEAGKCGYSNSALAQIDWTSKMRRSRCSEFIHRPPTTWYAQLPS